MDNAIAHSSTQTRTMDNASSTQTRPIVSINTPPVGLSLHISGWKKVKVADNTSLPDEAITSTNE